MDIFFCSPNEFTIGKKSAFSCWVVVPNSLKSTSICIAPESVIGPPVLSINAPAVISTEVTVPSVWEGKVIVLVFTPVTFPFASVDTESTAWNVPPFVGELDVVVFDLETSDCVTIILISLPAWETLVSIPSPPSMSRFSPVPSVWVVP